VTEPIEKTVNDESGKSVYVMSVYSKGPIRSMKIVNGGKPCEPAISGLVTSDWPTSPDARVDHRKFRTNSSVLVGCDILDIFFQTYFR
jgi:hypothetical protein